MANIVKDKFTVRPFEGPDTTKKAVFFNDSVYVGYVYQEIDGFYVFENNRNDGCWSEYSLKALYELLKELNAGWNAQLEEYFENGK